MMNAIVVPRRVDLDDTRTATTNELPTNPTSETAASSICSCQYGRWMIRDDDVAVGTPPLSTASVVSRSTALALTTAVELLTTSNQSAIAVAAVVDM